MEKDVDRKRDTIAYLNNMISSLKTQISELETQAHSIDPKDSAEQGEVNGKLRFLNTRLTELENHLKSVRDSIIL